MQQIPATGIVETTIEPNTNRSWFKPLWVSAVVLLALAIGAIIFFAVPRSFSPLANLTTYSWNNVMGANNVVSDRPQITNLLNNPGAITVRVVQSLTGDIISQEQTLDLGQSVRLDRIPWNSGSYTLQAKATVDGSYRINVVYRRGL